MALLVCVRNAKSDGTECIAQKLVYVTSWIAEAST